MERFFNIAGPCNPVDHYMLPAMARLPEVVSLIRKKQYFMERMKRVVPETPWVRDDGLDRGEAQVPLREEPREGL